ncbi:response regulator [Myxococcota bacterium]
MVLAEDGKLGLDIFRGRHEEIHLVVLDAAMPVMDGAECLEKLAKIDPHVRVLVCSGFADQETAKKFLSRGACGFLGKPFSPGELGEAVARAIEDSPPAGGYPI